MTFTLNFCSDNYPETIMATASYLQGISICHWNCALLAYFDLLTLISPLPCKSCLALCLKIINDIFSGHIKPKKLERYLIKLTWNLHIVILTFLTLVLEIMTFDFKILFENCCSAQPLCLHLLCCLNQKRQCGWHNPVYTLSKNWLISNYAL